MNQFEMKDLLYGEHPSTVTAAPQTSIDCMKSIVFWETNTEVKRNVDIPDSQKIAKTSTHDFPEGVTVRTNNMKNGTITVYFHGEKIKRTHWTYHSSKLIVNFPRVFNHGNIRNNFTFNGELPKDMTFNYMGNILEYIKHEAMKMYGKIS